MLYYFKYERNLLFSFSKVPGRTITVGMFILIMLDWSLWPLQVIPKIPMVNMSEVYFSSMQMWAK